MFFGGKIFSATRVVFSSKIFAKKCALLVAVAILPLPEERSSQLLHGGTLKSRKFLLARRTGHEILHARTVGEC